MPIKGPRKYQGPRNFNTALIAALGLVFAIAGLSNNDAAAKSKTLRSQLSAVGAVVEVSTASLANSGPILTEPAALAPPARFFTINEVLAKRDGLAAKSDAVRLAASDPSDGAVTDTPNWSLTVRAQSGEPFGLFTFRAPEGQVWAKWRAVEADMRAENKIVASCRVNPGDCPSHAAMRFIALVEEAKTKEGRARFETVNRSVNAAIRYVSDFAQHGVPDLWSAPLATLASGMGDCEDYAIAKYAILLDAGVAADDMRLLLVRDRIKREDHAILAVRHEQHWLVLDSRLAAVAETQDVRHYMPLYAIDQQGVKLFAAPYAQKQPANRGAGAGASLTGLQEAATPAGN
jgi:predicted transglutaminase-like cysteine proteinase